MIDRIKNYIGWWLLIPALVIVLLQIPGCIIEQEKEKTKQIQIMVTHCETQGKTYLTFPDNNGATTAGCVYNDYSN